MNLYCFDANSKVSQNTRFRCYFWRLKFPSVQSFTLFPCLLIMAIIIIIFNVNKSIIICRHIAHLPDLAWWCFHYSLGSNALSNFILDTNYVFVFEEVGGGETRWPLSSAIVSGPRHHLGMRASLVTFR